VTKQIHQGSQKAAEVLRMHHEDKQNERLFSLLAQALGPPKKKKKVLPSLGAGAGGCDAGTGGRARGRGRRRTERRGWGEGTWSDWSRLADMLCRADSNLECETSQGREL
jgi:hypothetical protein